MRRAAQGDISPKGERRAHSEQGESLFLRNHSAVKTLVRKFKMSKRNKQGESVYDIRIFRILPQDVDAFRIFDPLDRLDLSALPGTVVLGAMNMEDENDPDPAGVLIATEQEDRYLLEWLAVSPDYRGQEVGGELIDSVFTASENAALPFFSVCCTREIRNNGDGYFNSCWFEKEEETGHAYRLPLKALFNAKNLPKNKEDTAAIALKDLRTTERDLVWEYLEHAKHLHLLCSRPLPPKDADQELSCVWLEDNEIHGALLILSVENRHYPVLAAMDSVNELDALAAFCIDRAIELQLDEDELIVLCRTRHTDHIMNGYVGNEGRFYRKLLTADVSEFRSF